MFIGLVITVTINKINMRGFWVHPFAQEGII